jgi:peptidoglycan-associated lipoprotein
MKPEFSKRKLALNICLALAAGALTVGCAGNGVKKTETAVASKPVSSTVTETTKTEASENMAEIKPLEQTPVEHVVKTELAETVVSKFPEVEIVENTRPEQLNFQFGFDKAELSENDKQVVIQHARFLIDNPEMILKIQGHTDHHGPKSYNEYLSKIRAEAVAAILIEQGVQESQLEIVAMANEAPLADNEDSSKNRRVELRYSEINLVSNSNQ